MATNLRSTPLYAAIANDRNVLLRSAPMYAVVQDAPEIVVREVHGFAMEAVSPEVVIRELHAYVLQPVPKSGFFNQDGLTALKAAILKECGVTVPAAHGTFQAPVAATGPYDTIVPIKATPTGDYSGTVNIRYTRFSLKSDALVGKDLSVVVGSANSVHGRLAAINAAYGLKLATTDLVDAAIPAGQNWFEMTVASTSYLFQPGEVILIGTKPSNNLATLITTPALNSFQAEG